MPSNQLGWCVKYKVDIGGSKGVFFFWRAYFDLGTFDSYKFSNTFEPHSFKCKTMTIPSDAPT